jgi:Na+/melibiose symporter-like transporter
MCSLLLHRRVHPFAVKTISYHAKIFKTDANKEEKINENCLYATDFSLAKLKKYIFNTFVRRSQGLETKKKKISQTSCSVYTNRSLLILCIEFMLSYFFPAKNSCFYPKAILATGTVRDTAKNTTDNVGID